MTDDPDDPDDPTTINPYSVVCPACHAAVTARCLERFAPDGKKFVDYVHAERLERARDELNEFYSYLNPEQ